MAQVQRATIEDEIESRHRRSAALYQEALGVFPSGVTHDGRYMTPAPIYVTHARGSRKWDVDGNEYIDYYGGHGALILGHAHPAVTEAVVAQAQKGSHFGASHELEVRWGRLVQEIVPAARDGLVKFLSSGTEATLMALRLARAFTGKDVIVKMRGHFHGWHDYATIGMEEPWDIPISAGIPADVQKTVRVVPPGDIAALEAALAPGDVAALIMLQNGLSTEFLEQVRDLTSKHGVLLIFDEVVTGFRYAPGGAQEYFGVTPDLTTLAKILAGGYPGGAVCGRADVMALLEHRDDDTWQRRQRIAHPGTFNANPVSAAAGTACLEIVRDPAIQRRAAATADALRQGINDLFARRGAAGRAGGELSIVGVDFTAPRTNPRRLNSLFRAALQLHGVDVSHLHGSTMVVSAVHDDRDIADTLRAYDRAVEMLQAEAAI